MSDPRDKRPEEMDDDELRRALAEAEAESDLGDQAPLPLSDQIAEKWDPKRLLKLVSSRAGRGEPLDEATRRRYEKRLGVDLSDVRVFRGSFAEEINKAHSAEAITVGRTGMIFMGNTAGRSPATSRGRALLAHELTHVAQGRRGIYRAGYQGQTPLATEEAEAEAERAEDTEMSGSGGGRETDPDHDRKRAELVQKLFARLVEVFEEEERIWELRNGLPRFRS